MPQNVFTSCSPIVVGCFLYTDIGLTTPAPDGEYSDGLNTFTITGGAGEITGSGTCPTTTTTTTTSTTTEAPTTTTTTSTTTAILPSCTEYFNNTASTYSVSYTACGGGTVSADIAPNDSFCAEDGTCSGCGFLTILGSC